jgi:hypothetical protein
MRRAAAHKLTACQTICTWLGNGSASAALCCATGGK